jgi:hypothetical protein
LTILKIKLILFTGKSGNVLCCNQENEQTWRRLRRYCSKKKEEHSKHWMLNEVKLDEFDARLE